MNTQKPISLLQILSQTIPFGLVLAFEIPILWKSNKQGKIDILLYVIQRCDQYNNVYVILYMICIYRSIDSHTLIGNIGGYIGLCLGYNLLQAPALVAIVLKTIKGYFKSQNLIKNSNPVSKPFGTIQKNSKEHNEEQNNPNGDK